MAQSENSSCSKSHHHQTLAQQSAIHPANGLSQRVALSDSPTAPAAVIQIQALDHRFSHKEQLEVKVRVPTTSSMLQSTASKKISPSSNSNKWEVASSHKDCSSQKQHRPPP